MSRIILVTGGARSGKSTFAEELYSNKKDVVYIATARVTDNEMKDRILFHQKQRPEEWITIEANYRLSEIVNERKNYLLDCITVLTSNIMFDITGESDKIPPEIQVKLEKTVVDEISLLIDRVKQAGKNLVMVTNEVGNSIVPENNVARIYRDIAGRVNQKIAKMCSEVYLVTCGIPLRLK
ncbi:MAG: bifunctional adenosylcobinamide kinase/adenosylcobinamide-phosphate guanylyltransferase [Acetivibrionales bacterium]|jgi:adenosylcobinamide kinase/adenosylcobinamide-phosphate guanylyltransferase